jgi:predicted RNA binding protein with dsRBD fold (UPF0201 family)
MLASANASEQMVAAAQVPYTCDQVNKLKFNVAEYTKLPGEEQILVDVQFQACKPENQNKRAYLVPATDKGKPVIGYGLLGEDDIRHIGNYCNVAGTVVGSKAQASNPVLGALVAGTSGGACKGFADALTQNNVIALVAPSQLMGTYVVQGAASQILSPADAKNVTKAINNVVKAAPKATVKDGKVEVKVFGNKMSTNVPWR